MTKLISFSIQYNKAPVHCAVLWLLHELHTCYRNMTERMSCTMAHRCPGRRS